MEYNGYYSKAEKPLGAIAVLHGIGEHFGRYEKFADYMARRGYSVYGIDLPGHGKSPGIRGQIGKRDEFYGLVDTLLDHVRHEEPGVPKYLMGHSMGGNLALSYRIAREKGGVPRLCHHFAVDTSCKYAHRNCIFPVVSGFGDYTEHAAQEQSQVR